MLGYGASNDAHRMAQPDPESIGVAEMMLSALERSEVEPARVGYINAHGTSTPLGDAAETRAIKQASATMPGRWPSPRRSRSRALLRRCGRDRVDDVRARAPPPAVAADDQLPQPGPECDLDYVPNEAREAELDVALSNAMGLGGHNGCVLLGRVA